MVRYQGRPFRITDSRIMILIKIAALRYDNRFVKGKPPLYPVSEQFKAFCRVRRKCLRRFPVLKASLLHPVHGQIKVMET